MLTEAKRVGPTDVARQVVADHRDARPVRRAETESRPARGRTSAGPASRSRAGPRWRSGRTVEQGGAGGERCGRCLTGVGDEPSRLPAPRRSRRSAAMPGTSSARWVTPSSFSSVSSRIITSAEVEENRREVSAGHRCALPALAAQRSFHISSVPSSPSITVVYLVRTRVSRRARGPCTSRASSRTVSRSSP